MKSRYAETKAAIDAAFDTGSTQDALGVLAYVTDVFGDVAARRFRASPIGEALGLSEGPYLWVQRHRPLARC